MVSKDRGAGAIFAEAVYTSTPTETPPCLHCFTLLAGEAILGLMAAWVAADASTLNDEDRPIETNSLLEDEHESGGGAPHPRPLSGLVIYFMTIHFLLAFCEIILVAPLIKLFENSLCLSYYDFPVNGVEESLCKISDIQRPLATIRGWKSMFDTFPGI